MMKRMILTTTALVLLMAAGRTDVMADTGKAEATLGGGCFWCLEAAYDQLEGVIEAESGYAGGQFKATYEEVCSGSTGHAEVVRVFYDPSVISYEELLTVFFSIHDPTTLNRQGADVGTQYRSAIFYHDAEQKAAAEQLIAALTEQKVFKNPIVTEVTEVSSYFKAEKYHQDYYVRNKSQGYCRAVINPKLAKFRKDFEEKLKKDSS
jgi:peptide-methionine (S)-S-oxide reductase